MSPGLEIAKSPEGATPASPAIMYVPPLQGFHSPLFPGAHAPSYAAPRSALEQSLPVAASMARALLRRISDGAGRGILQQLQGLRIRGIPLQHFLELRLRPSGQIYLQIQLAERETAFDG